MVGWGLGMVPCIKNKFPNQGWIVFQPPSAFYHGTWLHWPQVHPKWIPKWSYVRSADWSLLTFVCHSGSRNHAVDPRQKYAGGYVALAHCRCPCASRRACWSQRRARLFHYSFVFFLSLFSALPCVRDPPGRTLWIWLTVVTENHRLAVPDKYQRVSPVCLKRGR